MSTATHRQEMDGERFAFCYVPGSPPSRRGPPFLEYPRGEIASIVRETRHAQGISQESLAERVDVSRNTIARIESAMEDPTVVSFTNICFVLGIRGLIIGTDESAPRWKGLGEPLPVLPATLINEAIARVIDSLRQHFGVSREQCQSFCGVHRNTIQRMESVLGNARVSTVYRLYRMFDVDTISSPDTDTVGPVLPAGMSALHVQLRGGDGPIIVSLR